MPIVLPPDVPHLPAMVTQHVLDADRLRQRGAVLAGEALADWSLLTPAGRGVVVAGLPDTLVLLDGLRLTPAANGAVDLSVLPLAWLDGAALAAGPGGAAHGAGALGGTLDLQAAGGGSRLWALAGTHSGRGIGGIDTRIGTDNNWLGAGFTQGGALPTAGGLAATGQGRWQLGGQFSQGVAGATLMGRALLARRREGADRADHHDLALRLSGGTGWRWQVAAATGGHVETGASSQQTLVSANISRMTAIVLPGAVDAVSLAVGGEVRRLRLAATAVSAREAYAEAHLPLLQDRPAAEDLALQLGWRQAWIAGRSEPLWSAGARWEFFPGLTLRGQVARSVDDFARVSGVGRSVGFVAVPAFLPGFALAIDWRTQRAGPARVAAVDLSVSLRRPLAGGVELVANAMATQHRQAERTPLPVARFQSLLRAGLAADGWTVTAGWRHRSSLAGVPARGVIDASVERQLNDKLRIIASVSNASDAGSAPVGRQALLQLVAGF